MLIHLIFDSNDFDTNFAEALKAEGHTVECSTNYSIASRKVIKQDEKPDLIICSDNAFEGNISDKYDYLSVYLQEIRQNIGMARIILVTMKQPPMDFMKECRELQIELKIGGELDIDLSGPSEQEPMLKTVKGSTDVSVIVAVPETMETRVRSIHRVQVAAKAKNRAELEEKASLLIPDVILMSFDLPGDEDMILLTKRIPRETRIIMLEHESMNLMVHDRLEENGVEFISDMSVDALEKVIVKDTLLTGSDEEPSQKPMKSLSQKNNGKILRGKRININFEKFLDAAGNVTNATHSVASALSGASRTVSNAAKNFKLSVKSKAGRLFNVISVCSPVPTGKSFFAANISTKLVEFGYKVTLLDLSRTQAQHTYFKMDTDEDGLKQAIEEAGNCDNLEALAFEVRRLKGLSIYACDPDIKVKFSSNGVLKLLKYASETSDFVIVDMPQNTAGGFGASVLSAAQMVFIIADMDMAHISIFTRSTDFDDYDNKLLVINKFLQSSGLNTSQIRSSINVDSEKIFHVPCKYNAVIHGISSGIPACTFDSEMSAAFHDIAEYLETNIPVREQERV